MDDLEERSKAILAQAIADVREKRRAVGQMLHGWRHEAAILALMRALSDADRPGDKCGRNGQAEVSSLSGPTIDARAEALQASAMIRLTLTDGREVNVRKADVMRVDCIADGAVLFLNDRPPLKVLQSAIWVMTRITTIDP